ncbi:hypothetical protein BC835DRAFT_1420982 [Cytidiella melzeri]|nr:hypothetical protein BC835DRAFT_1420982 [Cytidiella melzeri]
MPAYKVWCKRIGKPVLDVIEKVENTYWEKQARKRQKSDEQQYLRAQTRLDDERNERLINNVQNNRPLPLQTTPGEFSVAMYVSPTEGFCRVDPLVIPVPASMMPQLPSPLANLPSVQDPGELCVSRSSSSMPLLSASSFSVSSASLDPQAHPQAYMYVPSRVPPMYLSPPQQSSPLQQGSPPQHGSPPYTLSMSQQYSQALGLARSLPVSAPTFEEPPLLLQAANAHLKQLRWQPIQTGERTKVSRAKVLKPTKSLKVSKASESKGPQFK